MAAYANAPGVCSRTSVVSAGDRTDPPGRIRWQATTRKRHLDEALRRDRFRRYFVRAHG